ncbi:MAG TPA: hypothetical protein PK950_02405 [Candidatus Paceibacterota bacterium]|nr:hypothetical protein [Candidatus Paceibacterota bacterium]
MEKYNYAKPGHEEEMNKLKVQMQKGDVVVTDNEVQEVNSVMDEPRAAKKATAENLKLPEPTEAELLSKENIVGNQYVELFDSIGEDLAKTELRIMQLTKDIENIEKRKMNLYELAHDEANQTQTLQTKITNVERTEAALRNELAGQNEAKENIVQVAKENRYDEYDAIKDVNTLTDEIKLLQAELEKVDKDIRDGYGEGAKAETSVFLNNAEAREYNRILNERNRIQGLINSARTKIIEIENRH